MDNRRFDSLAKSLASGASRRSVLKGILGLGGAALAGGVLVDGHVDAARRSTPTPKPITCPGQQTWNGSQCVCPAGTPDKCGPDCCNSGGSGADYSECCDNACCYGTCYGEEMCCPYPREFCPISGECCPEGWTCCPDYGCISPDQCCTADDCPFQECFDAICSQSHVCSYGDDCLSGQGCCEAPLCYSSACQNDGSCGEPIFDCRTADSCCGDDGVCRDNGQCGCVPDCDGTTCGDDGCGGICTCADGTGCGDDGICHYCTACTPIYETCGSECYTFCTDNGIVCLSAFAGRRCTSASDCNPGGYCMDTCLGFVCLHPCGGAGARIMISSDTEDVAPTIDVMLG